MEALAVMPTHCSVLTFVALALGFFALRIVRVRRRQSYASSDGQSPAFKVPPITTASTPPRRRHPLQVDSHALASLPTDEADPLQLLVASFLRCFSCLDTQGAAQAKPFAALKVMPPQALPAVAPPSAPPESIGSVSQQTVSARLASELRNLQVELTELRFAEPDLAHEVERISEDLQWLQCFWMACHRNVEATKALIRSYASSVDNYKLDGPQVAEILSAGLIDILPGGDDDCAVVAVVHDVRIIAHLLQTHSFHDLVAAHLAQLKLLLKTSARARRHGVSMVHDLSELSWALLRSMLDPRNLHAQLRGAQFLFTAFPVCFRTIVVVDAPPMFRVLLDAVKAIAPGAIPEPLQFVSRPEAEPYCDRIFDRHTTHSPLLPRH